MFLRTVKVSDGKGGQYEYVRLVESFRVDGRCKQRVVCNLGPKALLLEHIDGLNRLLCGSRRKAQEGYTSLEWGGVQAFDWGPMLVVRWLWQQLGLERCLDRRVGRGRSSGRALSDRALVLVANRLTDPSSEHGLASWLESAFACDRTGKRLVAEWRKDAERLGSKTPRVRVELRQLKQWYRTLDQLLARKEDIEQKLYLELRTLFSLKVDLAFYDMTSTYFEGAGPAEMGAHGHSKDGKPRNPQVMVGVVMVGGFPITHHVFPGNTREALTVPGVLDDLEKRFGVERVIFVGDRGMVTSNNIAEIRQRGQGYIVGLQRRNRQQVTGYIESATEDNWIPCPGGIAASEKRNAPRTLVQEVAGSEEGVRVFVVHSDERLGYERDQRLRAMARVRNRLEALKKRVRKGRLKDPAKVGAAAARALAKNHGHRYYDWEYQGGQFRFFEHPINLKRERLHEGKYVIQTEEKDVTPLDVVRTYKELSEVERGFATIKDVLEMRPIWHQRDDRVRAHIFVATLGLLLHRCLEKSLRAAGLDISATQALKLLRTVHVIEYTANDGRACRRVTNGSSKAAAILRALKITDKNPPGSVKTAPITPAW